jgi:peptidoglycan hydrolase-like protein with peptidoglycan-binding domain
MKNNFFHMNIKDIQHALTTQGFDTKGIDGIAGANTYAAVKAFQEAHGLPADSVLNFKTLNSLFPGFAWSLKLNERALQIACSMIGVREEKGPNDGLMVAAFQKDVDIHAGDSWCMALVVWSYDEASRSLGLTMPLVRTGSCMNQLTQTKCRVIPAEEYTDPQPGDIGIIDLGHWHGHTYLVAAPGCAGVVDSVEGNTNIDGSANGIGVFARQRIISHTKAFIRP